MRPAGSPQSRLEGAASDRLGGPQGVVSPGSPVPGEEAVGRGEEPRRCIGDAKAIGGRAASRLTAGGDELLVAMCSEEDGVGRTGP